MLHFFTTIYLIIEIRYIALDTTNGSNSLIIRNISLASINI